MRTHDQPDVSSTRMVREETCGPVPAVRVIGGTWTRGIVRGHGPA